MARFIKYSNHSAAYHEFSPDSNCGEMIYTQFGTYSMACAASMGALCYILNEPGDRNDFMKQSQSRYVKALKDSFFAPHHKHEIRKQRNKVTHLFTLTELIQLRISFEKFRSGRLKELLLATGDVQLVFADEDAVLGTGWTHSDPKYRQTTGRWPGQNLHGKVLMKIREFLREGGTEVSKIRVLLGDSLVKGLNADPQLVSHTVCWGGLDFETAVKLMKVIACPLVDTFIIHAGTCSMTKRNRIVGENKRDKFLSNYKWPCSQSAQQAAINVRACAEENPTTKFYFSGLLPRFDQAELLGVSRRGKRNKDKTHSVNPFIESIRKFNKFLAGLATSSENVTTIRHLNFGQNKNLFGLDLIHLNRDGSKLLARNLYLGVMYHFVLEQSLVGVNVYDTAEDLISMDSDSFKEYCLSKFDDRSEPCIIFV